MFEKINFSIKKESIIFHNFGVRYSPYLYDYRQIGHLFVNNDYSNIKSGFEEYCILAVTSGQMELVYSGSVHIIKEQQYAFFDMRQKYELRPKKDNTSFYFTFFGGSNIDNLYKTFSTQNPLINPCHEDLISSFNKIINVAKKRTDFTLIKENILISDLYSHLLTILFIKQIESKGLDFIDSTYVYIKDHYKEDIKLDLLAEEKGYSKYYFIKQFKNKYGETPMHFLNCYRAKRTIETMNNKNIKIEDAALQNGFKDKRSFLRICKILYGVVPSTLRKNIL